MNAFTAGARAQPASTVQGHVVDSETGSPLADAHVFIASSMIGSITKTNGRFLLQGVPAGGHTFYVSMLGYHPVKIDTVIRSGRTYTLAIALEPAVLEGPEVVVTAERHPSWYRRLRKFERLFIGESPRAKRCELLNPHVLSFDATWWGKLTAAAREPLKIENRALGYEVTYFLEEFEAAGGTIRFDGEPLFKELIPLDSAEAATWRANREEAFRGSFRHFMLAFIHDDLKGEGFTVSRRYNLDGGFLHGDRFGFRRDRVLRDGEDSEEDVLDFNGYIEAVYAGERADREFLLWQFGSAWAHADEQRSLLKLTDGPTRVDHTGEILDPYGVTVYGYFAYERVGDLVPKEYRPAP